MTQADRASDERSTPAGPELVEAARGLVAGLRADGDVIETGRHLPTRWVEEFSRAGFFRLCVPRSLGGPEVHPRTLVELLECLATGDASASWCVMIAATSGVLAGYLPPEEGRRVFGSSDAVAGGVFAPRGRATRVPRGFRVNGRWSFASGCQHARWLMGGCTVQGADGPERTAAGRPDVRLMLFPAEQAEILDTWRVAGLCGTGSHDIAVSELFVPEARGVSFLEDAPRESGPLYAFPVFGLLAVGIAGVALGIARRALDELCELAGTKTPTLARRRLAERAATQSGVAQAEAELGAARAFLMETVERTWETAAREGTIGPAARARVRLAATQTVRGATRVVDAMYELGGGSSLYATSPLQRQFRDVHALTQHVMVSPASLELAGRVLLGIETDVSML